MSFCARTSGSRKVSKLGRRLNIPGTRKLHEEDLVSVVLRATKYNAETASRLVKEILLGGAITNPRVFGSLALLPSESPVNTDVSRISPIASRAPLLSKIILQFFWHP